MFRSFSAMMDECFARGIILSGSPLWKRIVLRLLPKRYWRRACNRLHILHYDGIPLFYSATMIAEDIADG